MAHLQLIQQSIFINVRKWNGNFSTMKYAICDCSNKNRVNSQYLTLLQVTLNHGSQTQIYWRARFQGKILRGPQFITKKPQRAAVYKKSSQNKQSKIKIFVSVRDVCGQKKMHLAGHTQPTGSVFKTPASITVVFSLLYSADLQYNSFHGPLKYPNLIIFFMA